MNETQKNAELEKMKTAPTHEYIWWAYAWRDEFDPALQAWRSKLWNFVRLLKAHRELQHHDAEDALEVVEQHLRRDETASSCWSEHFGLQTSEDAHVEFIDLWTRVRYVPGNDTFDRAVAFAVESPIAPQRRRTDGYDRFISIAGWLQALAGDAPILLPCEKLSAPLGCEPMTVSRYRRWATEDRLLCVIKPHRYGHGRNLATAFRFIGTMPQLPSLATKSD